ncbi:MAG: carbon monoxide dehydrogenase [Chloroflexi bacterium]|nr:MAG: carbon monoxide dehydrogenase [Chloroflexota bacterium]TMD93127.1 MAG: carbon monoxide dehydrogenase [Chloroflexota bacterium]
MHSQAAATGEPAVQIENSFAVDAPADRVYAFLLDVNSVMGCVPGAELSEIVDADTFHGRVRIRVGAITVAYQGTGHVVSRDEAARTAVLEADGREVGGSGSARAVITVRVGENGDGTEVTMLTDLSVVGRAAQVGNGLIEEVSRRLLTQMATCIGARLSDRAVPLPTPILSAEPAEPPGALDRALALAKDRPVALATLAGAGAAAAVVAVLLRARRR